MLQQSARENTSPSPRNFPSRVLCKSPLEMPAGVITTVAVFFSPRCPAVLSAQQQFPTKAMVYFDIMADWVKAMHFVSSSNRVMEKLNFLGGSKKASSEELLVAEIEALERQVRAFDALVARLVL